ncbi:MAG: T9SS type A sorting domain-containing protein [Candidatus Gracilibacteria bacterium]|nr:T9SS type A sorting domain-containing protein [Candidatus Gracilibacteria bacterium]
MSGMAQEHTTNMSQFSTEIDPYSDALTAAGEYSAVVSGNIDEFGYSNSEIDVFLSENLEWSGTISGQSGIGQRGVPAIDTDGNLYVACYAYGETTLPDGSTVSLSTTWYSFLLAKFDASGNTIWTQDFLISGSSTIRDLEVNGNKITTEGILNGEFFASTDSTISSNSQDFFTVVYDTAGNYQWANVHGSSNGSEQGVESFILGSSVYATGSFRDTASFGTINKTAVYGNDYYIASYGLSDGSTNWVATPGGLWDNENYLFSTGYGSGIYVAGSLQSDLDLKDKDDNVFTTLQNYSGEDIFLASYNTSSSVLWGKSYKCSGTPKLRSIAYIDNGTVFVGGSIQDTFYLNDARTAYFYAANEDPFMMMCDASNGDIVWAQHFPGSGTQEVLASVKVANNKLFTLGQMSTNSTAMDMDPSQTGTANLNGSNGQSFVIVYENHNAYMGGSSDPSDSANWSGNHLPVDLENLLIPAGLSNNPTFTSAASCDEITIEDGASLIGQGNLTHTTAYVQKEITGWTNSNDGWHFLSAPVASMTISGSPFAPGASDDLYRFSESDHVWLNYKDGTNPPGTFSTFETMVGYLVARASTETLSFEGSLNVNSSYQKNLTNSNSGWNLVGNPYSSKIDWSEVSLVNADSPKTIDKTTGAYNDLGVDLDVCEGIFLYASGAGASLTIESADQTHGSVAKKDGSLNQARLFAGFGVLSVHTTLVVDPAAAISFDPPHDARYLTPFTEIPWLCHYLEGDDVFVSKFAFSEADQPQKIRTYFKIPDNSRDILMIHGAPVNSEAIVANREVTNEMEITFSLEGELLAGDVFLKDNATGTETDLSEGETYTFTASSEDDPWRFTLLFSPVEVEEVESDEPEISIFPNPVQDVMTIESESSDIFQIVSLSGQVMREFEVDGSTQVNLSDLPSGMYLLKSKTNVKSTKIIKRGRNIL